jgi:hypothetical protein
MRKLEIKIYGAYEPPVFIKAGNFSISYLVINVSRKTHFTMGWLLIQFRPACAVTTNQCRFVKLMADIPSREN